MSATTQRSGPAAVTLESENVAYLGFAIETADGRVTLRGWRRIRIGDRFVFPTQGTWSWPRSEIRELSWLMNEERIAA